MGTLRGPNPRQRVSVEARWRGRRQNRVLRNRRIKAVLAGGLVYGIGSAATLASWTDTEEASGSFEAGTFNIELAVDGSWSSTSEMTFDASGMYPGSKVYAPVFVRTTPDTTMNGELAVSSAGASGSADGIAGSLEYRAVTESIAPGQEAAFGNGCTASAFDGSSPFIFGGASSVEPLLTAAAGEDTQELGKDSGSIAAYCFEVTLPTSTPNAAQGTSASNIWTFDAESVETPRDAGAS
ncbi:SipW-dependent-type signal peptide-containing protein [Brevibacterium marinum]|uniref:Putative ribosomally synthesized peptide with SipW-like signal peptide n=2 Tax=Brevibacterium marinum TaxID=418643 RepID=A0A846RWG3_9MICO|nr:SipW-dependent-type signal peptide-containing protein [Brevibacterium marinum]NJC58564.1 putative ribosomally synthesized peptide with SipW-like signal peptide [Brevibacterium marinum]